MAASYWPFFLRLIPLTNKYNSTMEAVSGIVGNLGSSGNVSQANLIQRTVTYKSSSEEINNKAMALLQKAEKVLANSTSTKREALELEQEVKDALNRTQGENKIYCCILFSGSRSLGWLFLVQDGWVIEWGRVNCQPFGSVGWTSDYTVWEVVGTTLQLDQHSGSSNNWG